MDESRAWEDIEFIKNILARTRKQVDPGAPIAITWGVLILFWFPAMQFLQNSGRLLLLPWVSLGGLVVGVSLTAFFVVRIRRRERGRTGLGFKIGMICNYLAVTGVILTCAGPLSGFFGCEYIPHLWGIIYAFMFTTIGILLHRDFLITGFAVFASVIAALFLVELAGYIFALSMGAGSLFLGLRSLKRLRAEVAAKEA